LLLTLNEGLGCTVVIVTHELDSIFAIADDSILLDAETGSTIARGDPKQLRDNSEDERVQRFLLRGKT
jgi:phospholipid/cholesterol/gamma-HCH transport system ATP-binding protein